MKLFSLKKQNNTIESNQEQANYLDETNDPIAEKKVGLNDDLHLGATANSVSLSNTPKPAVNDEFSLDTIDLNALEVELLNGKTDYTKTDYTKETKTNETPVTKELSFDDFDMDELFLDFEPKDTAITTQKQTQTQTQIQSQSQNQASTVATGSISKVQGMANLPASAVDDIINSDRDDFDFNETKTTSNSIQPPEQLTTFANANLDKKDKIAVTLVEPVSNTAQSTRETNIQQDVYGDNLALTSDIESKFASSNELPVFQKSHVKQPDPVLSKKTTAKNPKPLYLLLGIVVVLAAAAWYFLGQSSETATTAKVEPKNAVKPKSTTTAQPTATTPAVTVQASSALPAASAVIADIASSSSAQATAVATITPEEILKPTLPEDPAIAKEEMTRLSDQSAQLKEQEAMMEDQLRMMNELSSKKEERIKLLEQQVAQLEQQKAAQK